MPFSNPIVAGILELVISCAVGLVTWPIVCVIFIALKIARVGVAAFLNFLHGECFQLVEGADGVFGFTKPGNSYGLITSYGVFEGKPNVQLIRKKFSALLNSCRLVHAHKNHQTPHKLSTVLCVKLGFYCWQQTGSQFKIENHIRLVADSTTVYNEDKILQEIEELFKSPLPGDKPQWELLIFPKYADSTTTDKWAMIFRIHHAYGDAISFLLMANNNLFEMPLKTAIDPTKPFPVPKWVMSLAYFKCFVMGPYLFLRTAISFLCDQSLFRVENYSTEKFYTKSKRTVDLELIKSVKEASGVSVTAILISSIYTALRRTHQLVFEGQSIPHILNTANVAAMLPYSTDSRLRNQFTVFGFPAPFSESDHKNKLRLTHDVGLRITKEATPIFNYYVTQFVGLLPVIAQDWILSMTGTPVMLSNVPGITEPVQVFGTTLVDVAAWLPLITITGVGIVAFSYCGQLRFCAVGDPKAVGGSKENLQLFVDDIVKEIRILADLYLSSAAEGKVKFVNDSLPRRVRKYSATA